MSQDRAATPFVIVADLRTGSTLLSSSLNRHPDIRCYGELFHERDLPDNQPPGCDRHRLSAAALVDHTIGLREAEAVGFRAMLSHPGPERPQWSDLWDSLAARPDLRVVHLHRANLLAQYASLLVATQTGVFHPSPDSPAPASRPRLRVARDRFEAWIAEREALRARRKRALGARPSMEISYEELTGSWPGSIARILGFLGASQVPLAQAKRKQERRPLSEIIVNYDEVRDLRGGVANTKGA